MSILTISLLSICMYICRLEECLWLCPKRLVKKSRSKNLILTTLLGGNFENLKIFKVMSPMTFWVHSSCIQASSEELFKAKV
jgi:hypothetical protein